MNASCKSCGATIKEGVRYCTKCGNQLKQSHATIANTTLTRIISFYVIFLVFAFASYLLYENSESYSNLGLEITIEGTFILIVLDYCLIDYKSIIRCFKLPLKNWRIIGFSILFPVLSALFVYYILEIVNLEVLGLEAENIYLNYVFLDHPVFLSIFFFAILPPVFEELAFRGFLFNELIKISTPKITILGTAFIFALVHFSFISFIWIFPFGLVLGYLRHKYKTLWYGMVVHFIHNFLVLMLEIYYFDSLTFF